MIELTLHRSTTNWAQTFVNGSAVALLAFLFLLNLTQVLGSRPAWGSSLLFVFCWEFGSEGFSLLTF